MCDVDDDAGGRMDASPEAQGKGGVERVDIVTVIAATRFDCHDDEGAGLLSRKELLWSWILDFLMVWREDNLTRQFEQYHLQILR
jgi:hypothetical protein